MTRAGSAARSRGIAERLMDAATRHFATLGLARLRVTTRAANLAEARFYRALGCTPYGLTLERALATSRRR